MSHDLGREPPWEGERDLVDAPAEQEWPPALVQLFLENQGRELALRGEELAFRQREMEANYHYAARSMDAQIADRQDERREYRKERRDVLWSINGLAFLVAAFFAWLLYFGKEVFAMELPKAVLYVGGGGASGYFAGESRGKEHQKQEA